MATTRRAATRKPAAAPRSNGVGESRPHAAYATDPEAFEQANPLNDPRHPANCTLGGDPIPEHLWSRIMYGQTDQGMAEREEETRDNPKPTPGLEFVRDEVHQSIRRHGDDLVRGMNAPNASGVMTATAREDFDEDEAYDPRVQLVRQHVPDGMRPKFLASHEVGGGNTAVDGYQICMDGNGNPVKHGTSTLAYIPEHVAVRRQAKFEQKSADIQKEIRNSDLLQQESALRGEFTPIADLERPDPGSVDLGLQEGSFGEELT